MTERSVEKILRSRVAELKEKVREHEGLVRALQAGEVDAVVVLQKDGATISHLKSDEPLYRTIVDALPQGVATLLSDGTIVYVNRHLAQVLGAPEDTLLGTNLLPHVAEVDRALFAAMLQRAVTSPQELAVTFEWVNGQAAVAVSAIRLPISGVDAIGIVAVDVRDQVARHAAEESSRAKDDLIASVSHELRTPLTSMMGWVQLLQLQLEDQPEHAAALVNLKNAVLAEIRIVDDLLDLSRSENGALSISEQEFDLRQPLRMAASFVNLQAQNKAVTLTIDLPERPIEVRGDPDRLRQVFVNLLSNAVKFTSRGEVAVRTKIEDGTVTTDVTDSGIGIVPEFLPFVFEPFRRGDRAQTYPGLGIGLAISRRLVEAHGGTITVRSEGAGKGATFSVKLPILT